MAEWTRVVAHVDMDAFYASIEVRDDSSLRGRPVAVGGDADRRGVVSAASYEARAYGVRSALPMKTALRLCPHLVVVPPNFAKYREASRVLHEVLDEFSPRVEPLSLDEAFLDLTGTERALGAPHEVGENLRRRIKEALEITGSVGISTSKFVAKLASDHRKPDGLTVVPPRDVETFVQSLPLERLWGVGPATLESLQRAGIRTMAALARADERVLAASLGVHAGALVRLAQGLDDRPVVADLPAKSISHEETFAKDVADEGLLAAVLLELTERVARRARRHRVSGRTVFVKLRTGDFRTCTRRRTLASSTDDAATIFDAAHALFHDAWEGAPMRLVGVGLQNLYEEEQLDLFTAGSSLPADPRESLHEAEDAIVQRWGTRALSRARVLLAQSIESTGSMPGRPVEE